MYKFKAPTSVIVMESSINSVPKNKFNRFQRFFMRLSGIKLTSFYSCEGTITIQRVRKGRGYLSYITKGRILIDSLHNNWLVTDLLSSGKEFDILKVRCTKLIPNHPYLIGEMVIGNNIMFYEGSDKHEK